MLTLAQVQDQDEKFDTSLVREIEMTLENGSTDPMVVLQFFKDFTLYGLMEAIAYVKSYEASGDYRTGTWDKMCDIASKIIVDSC